MTLSLFELFVFIVLGNVVYHCIIRPTFKWSLSRKVSLREPPKHPQLQDTSTTDLGYSRCQVTGPSGKVYYVSWLGYHVDPKIEISESPSWKLLCEVDMHINLNWFLSVYDGRGMLGLCEEVVKLYEEGYDNGTGEIDRDIYVEWINNKEESINE